MNGGIQRFFKIIGKLSVKRGELVLIHTPTVGDGIDEIGIFIEEIPINIPQIYILAKVLRQDGTIDSIASFFLKEI